MRASFSLLKVVLIIISFSLHSYAQTDDNKVIKDSLSTIDTQDSVVVVEIKKKKRLISFIDGSSGLNEDHSPAKAAIYSAIFPGLGQIYNKRFWKLPLVYGLGGILVFQIFQNHREYVDYRDALFLVDISQLPNRNFQTSTGSNPLFAFSRDAIATRKDTFRRARDRFILWSVIVYALNIVDAVVDAHLVNFDTGKQRLVNVTPELLQTEQALVPGINLQLNF